MIHPPFHTRIFFVFGYKLLDISVENVSVCGVKNRGGGGCRGGVMY